MTGHWQSKVDQFIFLSNQHGVRMIMVGGGAVNFHGYQRHSADVDFWIDTSEANLNNLKKVFTEMGFSVDKFPASVKEQNQNISLKFSPEDLDVELITRFDIGKNFDQAIAESIEVSIKKEKVLKWNVLNLEDLITSKIKASRPKDLLDIQQLREINKGL